MNIRVKPTRAGVSEFMIRINALDFKTLQDRMLRPITILDGVTFNKTVIDRFIEVFKQQISLNPTYNADEVFNIISYMNVHTFLRYFQLKTSTESCVSFYFR